MPELPEVEVLRRDLEKAVVGDQIRAVQVRRTANAIRVIRRHGRRRDFEDALAGARIVKVGRRGKYLLVHLQEDRVLVVHLGMSGQLLRADPSAALARHTHVIIGLEERGELRYVDPRTFGEMFATTRDGDGVIKELQDLGLDPLHQPLAWGALYRTLVQHRTKLKTILTDQRFICGIGNIYSDEILFLAGLRHDRPSDTLSSQEVRRLCRSIHEVLHEAILHRGTSADDEQYRDLYGITGEHQGFLRVYQREHKPCRRCRTPLERARWSNRSTYFCPRCQV